MAHRGEPSADEGGDRDSDLDLPPPELDGVADAAEQSRVFEALFGVRPERQWFGRYLVLGELGRGGMGVVLEAFDRTLNRPIALKVLHQQFGTQRLLREAQALAKLSHPHVVQVYEAGVAEGQTFIAMELVRGESLREWLEREPRPSWRECVGVYLQVGEGLAAAHAAGLVHRDFKPDNAIVDAEGRVRVLDFGLARKVDGAAASDPDLGHELSTDLDHDLEHDALEASLTKSGTVLGTPAYMPLEQIEGHEADARSDQFSFCVALYEALYAARPFRARSLRARALALREGEVEPPPRASAVPPAVRGVVLRGLAASPEDRWSSMDVLLTELRRRSSPRPIWRWLVPVGLAGALASVALWPQAGPCDALRGAGFPAWDESARAAVQAGLRGVELPFASEVWERTAEGLDRYADAWAGARLQACEATHVDKTTGIETYELRLTCLDRRAQRTAALVEQLSAADERMAGRAVQAVQALPPVEPCNDDEGLRQVIDEVSESLAPVEARVRELVSEAWALHQAGRSREGVERAQEAVAHAEPLGDFSAARGEAHLVRAQIHYEARRLPAAQRDFHAALEQAGRTRDTELRLDVLQGLTLLAGREQDRSTAEAWMVQARGELPHASDQPRRRVEFRRAEAYVAYWSGDHAAVLDLLGPAEAYYREHEGFESRLAEVLGAIGSARTALGELDAAVEAHREQLRLARGAGNYVGVASALHELGMAYVERDELPAAEDSFARALDVYSSIFGPGSPAAVQSRVGLVQALVFRGELELAIEHSELAREALEHSTEAELVLRAEVLLTVGALYMAKSRFEDAISAMVQAREIFAEMPDPDPVMLAMVDNNIGDSHRQLSRYVDARRSYARAEATLREHVDDDDPRWIRVLLGIGSLHQDQGEHELAIEPLERALGLLGEEQVEPDLAASVRWHLGRALFEADRDRRRGLDLVREGRQQFESLGRDGSVAKIDAWTVACGEFCQSSP